MECLYMFGSADTRNESNNAIPFAQFKTFSKIQEYAKDVQKCLIFMGESYHRIKRKAEQDACEKALECWNNKDITYYIYHFLERFLRDFPPFLLLFFLQYFVLQFLQ